MKRTITLILALALCLGLAVPVSAAGEYTLSQKSSFGSYGVNNRFTVDRNPVGKTENLDENRLEYTVSKDSIFTITYLKDDLPVKSYAAWGGVTNGFTFNIRVSNGKTQLFLNPETGKFVSPDKGLPNLPLNRSVSFRLPFDELGSRLSVIVMPVYYFDYPGDPDVSYIQRYMFIDADAKQSEYTGGCPTFYRAYVFDHGHGFGCKMTNPTNKTLSGRWGIIACGKDKNGRYFPVDANILTYTLPAGGTSDMSVYTTMYAYDDAGYQWQNTTINKDLWLLRVDLNSDADYQEMLAFASEYLSYNTAADKNFGDDGWSSRYLGENNARLSDTSASSDWLYANFGGALK